MEIKLTEPLLDTFKDFIKPFYRKCDYVRIECYLFYNKGQDNLKMTFECRSRLNTKDSIMIIENKILKVIDKIEAEEVKITAFRNSHMRTRTNFVRRIYRK